MDNQKFNKGDLVRVDEQMPRHMAHFKAGCEAIVIGSYADRYGGENTDSYTIHIRGSGRVSWYHEAQLTITQKGAHEKLAEWKAEERANKELKSSIDWIFSHGEEVLAGAEGATIGALADALGIKNLWGSHGEGFVYYQNSRMVLAAAEPFLKAGDKEGWLAFVETIKRGMKNA